MPDPGISDEAVEAACRAHQATLAGTDPETDSWDDHLGDANQKKGRQSPVLLEPEAQDIFRDAMRAAIQAFVEAHGFV